MPEAPTLYFVLGLIFVGLGVPLVQKRIPRNRWYGFRVAKTLSSDAIWYPANAIAGRDMVVAGSIVSICALVTLALSGVVESWALALVNLVVFVGSMIGATLHSFRALKRF